MSDTRYYFDNLNGEEFESYLHQLFERLGYEVELTPVTGDYGADLLVHKDGETTVIQAKRYNDKVGTHAIQEVIGAIHYYKADSGMVVTNNYFTGNAIQLAESAGVTLWNRDMLISMSINSLANNTYYEIQDRINSAPEAAAIPTPFELIDDELDEYFEDAVAFIIEKNKASTSMLQRQFRIGYNRVSRLIDDLERQGIIGPEDGSKPRKVLITQSMYENKFGKKYRPISKGSNKKSLFGILFGRSNS